MLLQPTLSNHYFINWLIKVAILLFFNSNTHKYYNIKPVFDAFPSKCSKSLFFINCYENTNDLQTLKICYNFIIEVNITNSRRQT